MSFDSLPTIDELEKSVAADSTDLDVRGELIWRLFDRYLFGEESDASVANELDAEFADTSEGDLVPVAALLDEIPADKLLYERALLALLDGDNGEAVDKFRGAASRVSQASGEPLSSDELWEWVEPLSGLAPLELYQGLIEGFSKGWPDSAPVLWLKASLNRTSRHHSSCLSKHYGLMTISG